MLTMRRLMVAMLTVSLLGAVACDNKKDSGEAAEADAPEGGEAKDGDKEGAGKAPEIAKEAGEELSGVAEQAKSLLEEGKPLNPKQYEALMLAIADCEVDDKRGYIDSKCEAFKVLRKARSNRTDTIKNITGMWSDLGQKHIGHESPAVRIYSAQLMGSLFGASADSQKLIIDAARKEKSPAVLMAMIRTVRSSAGKNPDITQLLLDMSRHDNEHVRKTVIVGLTSSWAAGTEKTLERAIEMIDGDASMDVRKAGCSNLGRRADEKALPTLEKYTAWPAKEAKLYNDCFRGLVDMWSSAVPQKKPSEKAYKLTVKLLSETPRSKERPAWTAMSSLGWASKEKFQEAAPWYDNKKMLKLLNEIIADKEYYWLGRNAAIDSYIRLGAEKKDIEALLKKSYKGVTQESKGVDKFVVKKLEEKIAKWDEEMKRYGRDKKK